MPHFALFLLKVRSLDHEELKEYIGIPNKAPQLLLRYCCAFLVPVFLFMTMQPRFLSACILGQLCLQHVMFYMVVSIPYPFFEPTNHIDCWHVPYNCNRTTTKTLLSPMDIKGTRGPPGSQLDTCCDFLLGYRQSHCDRVEAKAHPGHLVVGEIFFAWFIF